MMSAVSNILCAADLPDGSVVAENNVVYIRNHPTRTAPWRGTNSGYFGDQHIDEVLAAGGTVLRYGYEVKT